MTTRPIPRSPALRWGILLLILGGGLAVRLWIAPSYGYMGVEADLIEQKQSIHRALTLGIHEVYTPNAENDPALAGGEWTGGYFVNYPPVIIYLRCIPGLVYRELSPEKFALWDSELNYFELARTDLAERLANTRGFTVVAKLPGIVFDILIALAIFLFVSGLAGTLTGYAASAAYAFNPGIIITSAHWGQHDAVWVFFLAVSLYLLYRRKIAWSWAAYALAALTKPQAGAFALVIVALGLHRGGWRRAALAAAAALGTAFVVFLPFLLRGTFGETVMAVVKSVFGGEPFISCNASNAWWFFSGGRGYEVSDETTVLGFLSLRRIGLLAFLAANALVLWRIWRRPAPAEGLYLLAAVIGMSFFTLSTELHENHMMSVLPLLTFAVPLGRRIWWALAVLSVTYLLNLSAFDTSIPAFLQQRGFGSLPLHALANVTALVNTVMLAVLLWVFWKETARFREQTATSTS